MARIRLVLADDQPLVLDAFRALLEPEFDIVGTATSAQQLLAECERTGPDVVVLDASLWLLAGLDGEAMAEASPATRLVLLTSGGAADTQAARRLGADLVFKSSDAADLRRAIRVAVRRSDRDAATHVRPPATTDDRLVPGLTPRQLEVLRLLAGGHSMKEVASILDVTPRTVAFHKYKMMDQLHVETTAELVQFAVRHGVVSR
jgi:DNA-binding NarL/FixJ family response regulator